MQEDNLCLARAWLVQLIVSCKKISRPNQPVLLSTLYCRSEIGVFPMIVSVPPHLDLLFLRMCLLRVPLLVHTFLRNKSCTQASASSCYSAWKWPSVLWLKKLAGQSLLSALWIWLSLAFWGTSGPPLPLSCYHHFPSSVSCLVAINGTSHPVSLVRNPEGPFASLWPAPYKADHLIHQFYHPNMPFRFSEKGSLYIVCLELTV